MRRAVSRPVASCVEGERRPAVVRVERRPAASYVQVLVAPGGVVRQVRRPRCRDRTVSVRPLTVSAFRRPEAVADEGDGARPGLRRCGQSVGVVVRVGGDAPAASLAMMRPSCVALEARRSGPGRRCGRSGVPPRRMCTRGSAVEVRLGAEAACRVVGVIPGQARGLVPGSGVVPCRVSNSWRTPSGPVRAVRRSKWVYSKRVSPPMGVDVPDAVALAVVGPGLAAAVWPLRPASRPSTVHSRRVVAPSRVGDGGRAAEGVPLDTGRRRAGR